MNARSPARRTRGASRRPLGRDDKAVRHFVEHMAMAMVGWGFPRMPARVLMTMMCADEDTLGASELADRLGVSPAAISGAVRYLMHLGVLERTPVPGSRRDAYRLPDDSWYQASVTKGHALLGLADAADEGVRAVGGVGTAAGARVAEMAEFYRFVAAELDGLLDRWETRRSPAARPAVAGGV